MIFIVRVSDGERLSDSHKIFIDVKIFDSMKKRTEKENYRLFSVLLLEEKVYMNPSIRFKDICRWLGADAGSLGDTVSKELGMSGDLLLEKYRKADMLRIREKYGLDLDHENY